MRSTKNEKFWLKIQTQYRFSCLLAQITQLVCNSNILVFQLLQLVKSISLSNWLVHERIIICMDYLALNMSSLSSPGFQTIGFIILLRMQQQIDQIQSLTHQLIHPPICSPKKTYKHYYHSDGYQIQSLQVSDYLQLLAHQKKAINLKRWLKLRHINQNGMMEQQDYKHMFALACQAHFRRLQHPGYYKRLLEVKQTYPDILFVPIQKDVTRTFAATHPFYESLSNVLTAYAIRNPSLVYCQGMNYLVAFFLMNEVSAEQSFWIVACLIQNCLPDDYFKDLTTISIVVCIFQDVIGQLRPQFKDNLEQAGMDSSVLLVPWLVCLFSKGFLTSVSAYLISYLMLQSRQYRAGYILLKISIAILQAIINREDQLPFSKDFKSFKDEIEFLVHSVSLAHIKYRISKVKLDYSAYIKLQDYYKKEKIDGRTFMLKNQNRKIPLPTCNSEYPICFHRIEMQKKLGAIENAMILKNGMSIKEQMIQNYLEQYEMEQTNDISYSKFQQCEVGRQAHICHLSERESQSKVDVRNHKFLRQSASKSQILQEDQESLECELQLSTYEQRFKQMSEYFVVDDNYQTLNLYFEEDLKQEQQMMKQLQGFGVEKRLPLPTQSIKAELKSKVNQQPQKPESKGLRAFLTESFQKVRVKISEIQQIKQMKRSRTSMHSLALQGDNNLVEIASQNKFPS